MGQAGSPPPPAGALRAGLVTRKCHGCHLLSQVGPQFSGLGSQAVNSSDPLPHPSGHRKWGRPTTFTPVLPPPGRRVCASSVGGPLSPPAPQPWGTDPPQHLTWLFSPACLCRLEAFPVPAPPWAGLLPKQEQIWRPTLPPQASLPRVTDTLSTGRCRAVNWAPAQGSGATPRQGSRDFRVPILNSEKPSVLWNAPVYTELRKQNQNQGSLDSVPVGELTAPGRPPKPDACLYFPRAAWMGG